MAKGIKICRVCGKEYEACHTLRPNLNSEFRWQEVACSPECGQVYLRRILISRGLIAPDTAETAEPEEKPVKKARTRKAKAETPAAE